MSDVVLGRARGRLQGVTNEVEEGHVDNIVTDYDATSQEFYTSVTDLEEFRSRRSAKLVDDRL